VHHGVGNYAVIVRPGALAGLQGLLSERHPQARPVVIADATVAKVRANPLPDAPLLTFPAGERHKVRKSWAMLTDQLLDARFDRDTVVIAFGGGVTTDLAGFVAATYLRGVPWIAVPTSTLAMVDASVGGKTGVDTAAGKNLVGAFHSPSAVLCDPETLDTLPERNYREGLAEAVKHAAVADAEYGEWILAHASAIAARDPETLTQLVQRSVACKSAIVIEDERESGRRAVLNAGHTVAHAIEAATDFTLSHGEAVAIGLVLETRVAEAMGICTPGSADRVARLLAAMQLPVSPPRSLNHQRCLDAMRVDKKNRAGVIRASLLATFGAIARDGESWTHPLDIDVLKSLLRSS
jgi:3-dehydroquinate synthase